MSEEELDKLQKQEQLTAEQIIQGYSADTELADNAHITVNLTEIFGQELDE